MTSGQTGSAGVTARFLGHDTMYWGGIVKDNTGLAAQLWVEVSGTWTLLGSVHIPAGVVVIRLEEKGARAALVKSDGTIEIYVGRQN